MVCSATGYDVMAVTVCYVVHNIINMEGFSIHVQITELCSRQKSCAMVFLCHFVLCLLFNFRMKEKSTGKNGKQKVSKPFGALHNFVCFLIRVKLFGLVYVYL